MVDGFVPTTVEEALELKAKFPELVPYAGGTDLMVENRPEVDYLFLNRLCDLKHVTEDDEHIRIGSGVTFTKAIADPLVPQVMKDALVKIAAPAIRNAGTFGGNLGNGSAKADSVLVEYALGALIRVGSVDGDRTVPVHEFYRGRKQLDLAPNELILEVLLPKANLGPYYYEKVGGCRALAISRVAFCGVLTTEANADGNEVIRSISPSFGAVSGTVLRFPELERQFEGLTREQAAKQRLSFVTAYEDHLKLTEGRVSAAYRRQVCLNLLGAFLDAVGI